jgi:hypothetical protein
MNWCQSYIHLKFGNLVESQPKFSHHFSHLLLGLHQHLYHTPLPRPLNDCLDNMHLPHIGHFNHENETFPGGNEVPSLVHMHFK